MQRGVTSQSDTWVLLGGAAVQWSGYVAKTKTKAKGQTKTKTITKTKAKTKTKSDTRLWHPNAMTNTKTMTTESDT